MYRSRGIIYFKMYKYIPESAILFTILDNNIMFYRVYIKMMSQVNRYSTDLS